MTYPNLQIEILLKQALNKHFEKTDGKTPSNLRDSIEYSILSPGKRIRPRLLLACAEMVGLPVEAAIPPALALEMIHCFTLIHDDLPCLDNDDFRRGMPSNHKKFGEGLALLAGDGLMALAFDVFLDAAEAGIGHPHLIQGLKRFTWAIGPRGVIGGQAAESLLTPHSPFAALSEMHEKKTGALFTAALLIPKDFAGISDQDPKGSSIVEFGHELGLAFQIADDLEDAPKDPSAPAPTPTSVLFYLSRNEAAAMTIKNLTQAADQLKLHWGDGAAALSELSAEVVKKIQAAC